MDAPLNELRWLNTDQAGQYVNISPLTLQHWRQVGKGPPFFRVNAANTRRNVVRYDRRALDAWLAENTVTPGEQ
jgi:hypothetical protein